MSGTSQYFDIDPSGGVVIILAYPMWLGRRKGGLEEAARDRDLGWTRMGPKK
jgi:hypothetical protein